MFDRYIIEDDSSEAAARITSEMEADRRSREKIAQAEIKARDRVDITLEENERIKAERRKDVEFKDAKIRAEQNTMKLMKQGRLNKRKKK